LAELEEKVRRLETENASLTRRTTVQERVIESMGEMMREQSGIRSGRQKKTKPSSTKDSSDAEDDAALELEYAMKLVGAGVKKELAARAAGISRSTLNRRENRHRAGAPLVEKRGPGAKPAAPELLKQRAAARVCAVKGLIGAEALSHAVPGLSRREAAAVKKETLTVMEKKRKEDAQRVCITEPGVVRGFDAMHVRTFTGPRIILVAADAAVPFRTSITPWNAYDATSVASALDVDFVLHGAPLVARLDRCAAHTAPPVLEVFRRHGVLVLQGPPHHPCYYAHLERQNRDHRAWLEALLCLDAATLAADLEEMRESLNSLIPRRSLGWCTPLERWNARRVIDDDRRALREEVEDRAAQLRRTLSDREINLGYDMRFAIEQALMTRGYLECSTTRWC
jgi:hypothetical protein